MPIFYLIRHAENELVGKRLPGWLPNVHLNDRGRAQAEALPDILAPVRLAALYSSPLERAVETAEPLAHRQDLPIVTRADLGEIRVGRWEGQPLRRLRRLKAWSVVQSAPSLFRFPGGETYAEAQARLVAEIEGLRHAHRGKTSAVACVSHSDGIKLILAHYLGIPLDLFQRLTVEPASVSVLHISDAQVRLLSLNDTRATRARPPRV